MTSHEAPQWVTEADNTSHKWAYSFAVQPSGETTGDGTRNSKYGQADTATDDARQLIAAFIDRSIAKTAELIITEVGKELSRQAAQNPINTLAMLPPLRSRQLPDGGLALEWLTPRCRAGFAIEPDPTESSWYIISRESSGGLAASGELPQGDLSGLAASIIRLLLKS